MTDVGRTWKLWAYRYESGKFWHISACNKWVELHQLAHPVACGEGNVLALRITERQDTA